MFVVKEPINLGKFSAGINNVAPDTNLPESSLRSAINVNLDKEGNVISRKGYTRLYSGEDIHSVFDNYFVESSELKQLDLITNIPTIIADELQTRRHLAWLNLMGTVIYSNGLDIRSIPNNLFGIPTPPNNPLLTQTSGNLPFGTYQVAIVYQDTITGEIGGASLASKIHIADKAGIEVSNIPSAPQGYNVIIYCSTQNGEALYKNIVLNNGIDTHIIFDSEESTRVLDTQFMCPLLGGHILRHFKARLYVARDNVLWYSKAMRYGLHNPSEDFFQFASKITIVQPVTDGIYIVADKTYFLSGTEPKKMSLSVVSKDEGIEGTGITMEGDAFGLGADIEVGYWFSKKGATLGLPKGELKDITSDRLAINEDMQQGVSLYREVEGIKQLITSITKSGNDNGFKFGEQMTSSIYRNGVLVP